MISIDETLAAIDAIHDVCDLPVLCTVTVDANGNMFTGGNAVKAAVAFEKAGAAAVGINCSVGPEQLVSVVRNIKENVKVPVIAKPNAGMPTVDRHGNAIYTMQPEEFAKHLKVLVDTGASIVGGCCGTTPEFIRAAGKILSDSDM
jgi:5-methyltetrahydrofolate--homocysteine methyltransferase